MTDRNRLIELYTDPVAQRAEQHWSALMPPWGQQDWYHEMALQERQRNQLRQLQEAMTGNGQGVDDSRVQPSVWETGDFGAANNAAGRVAPFRPSDEYPRAGRVITPDELTAGPYPRMTAAGFSERAKDLMAARDEAWRVHGYPLPSDHAMGEQSFDRSFKDLEDEFLGSGVGPRRMWR